MFDRDGKAYGIEALRLNGCPLDCAETAYVHYPAIAEVGAEAQGALFVWATSQAKLEH